MPLGGMTKFQALREGRAAFMGVVTGVTMHAGHTEAILRAPGRYYVRMRVRHARGMVTTSAKDFVVRVVDAVVVERDGRVGEIVAKDDEKTRFEFPDVGEGVRELRMWWIRREGRAREQARGEEEVSVTGVWQSSS